jgi:hypothetical protein
MRMPPQAQCTTGKKIRDFANKPSDATNKTGKDILKRVGFGPEDEICSWDPGKHRHKVPALILKGSADPATNGCQAEHFFNKGLPSGERVFVEFPEAGHRWLSVIKREGLSDLRSLLEKFIELPVREFRQSTEVNQIIDRLGAVNRTPAGNDAISDSAQGC